MALYEVKANRWRRVKHKEGKLVASKRYYRGDVVDLTEDEAKHLVNQGGLAPYEETEQEEQTVNPEAPTAPEPESESSGVTEGTGDGDGDAAAEEETTDYEEFSYAELQQEAKGRGLSGAGSSSDLIARLQADDEGQQ